MEKSELKKILEDFRSFEHNRVKIGDYRFVEFSDENGNCISNSLFGIYNNIFDDNVWWPRIGESVKSHKTEDTFEVIDILTYMTYDFKRIKRFYLKKKTERKTITNV